MKRREFYRNKLNKTVDVNEKLFIDGRVAALEELIAFINK